MFIILTILISVFSSTLHAIGEVKEVSSSLEAYGYDKVHKDISSRTNQPVGIVIIAFNRPHYFKRLIESLEKNAESQTLPFYFILDGGPRAKQKENVDIINQSSIKHKEIILRGRNYGYAKTVIDTYRFMFDWCGFKKIIFFEEDLTVSPYYISLTLNLHEWATSNYSNVGIVSCWSYCFLSKEEKKTKLALVQSPPKQYWWSFVTYCLASNVWNDTKPLLYGYEKFIDKVPHTEKYAKARSVTDVWEGAPKIRAWVRNLCLKKVQINKKFPMLQFRTQQGKAIFPCLNIYKDISAYFCSAGSFGVNEDRIMAFSLWMKGYIKIETVVNRARHIGEVGVTGTHYNSIKTNVDTFDEDKNLKDFLPLI